MSMKRFKKIYIEITNVCNLSCAFCPVSRREKAFLSEEDFEDIIREVKPFTDYVYFHVKGEPLLHPKLGVFLDICKSYGIQVNITTNGTLILKALKELEGKEALRQINFSLHSFGGDKDKYLEDILTASKRIRMTTAANISYRFWNMQAEEEDGGMKGKGRINPEVVRDTEKYLGILKKEYGIEGSLKDMVPAGRGIKLAEKVYISRDYEFTWPSLAEEEDEGNGFCYGLRTHAGILSDGTVIPCCLDGEGVISLGNIKESSFEEILNSSRAKAIYEGFSNRRAAEELCRKCGYRKKFGLL